MQLKYIHKSGIPQKSNQHSQSFRVTQKFIWKYNGKRNKIWWRLLYTKSIATKDKIRFYSYAKYNWNRNCKNARLISNAFKQVSDNITFCHLWYWKQLSFLSWPVRAEVKGHRPRLLYILGLEVMAKSLHTHRYSWNKITKFIWSSIAELIQTEWNVLEQAACKDCVRLDQTSHQTSNWDA